MRIVFFGLTVTSSWGNGHATTYRSLLKALAARGHTILFIEKDVDWYRNNRDLPTPPFCSLHLYASWQTERSALINLVAGADAIVIGSYFPDAIVATQALLEHTPAPLLFYDIDTPITLAALAAGGATAYLTAPLIPHFAAYLSFSGGPALQILTETYGARRVVPFFCSVDPDLYHPAPSQPRFTCDLSYLGTYAPDRQAKLIEFLNAPAALLPAHTFRVAGPMYPADTPWQPNVHHLPHLAPPDHPAFYNSSRLTLNLTRAEMVFVIQPQIRRDPGYVVSPAGENRTYDVVIAGGVAGKTSLKGIGSHQLCLRSIDSTRSVLDSCTSVTHARHQGPTRRATA